MRHHTERSVQLPANAERMADAWGVEGASGTMMWFELGSAGAEAA